MKASQRQSQNVKDKRGQSYVGRALDSIAVGGRVFGRELGRPLSVSTALDEQKSNYEAMFGPGSWAKFEAEVERLAQPPSMADERAPDRSVYREPGYAPNYRSQSEIRASAFTEFRDDINQRVEAGLATREDADAVLDREWEGLKNQIQVDLENGAIDAERASGMWERIQSGASFDPNRPHGQKVPGQMYYEPEDAPQGAAGFADVPQATTGEDGLQVIYEHGPHRFMADTDTVMEMQRNLAGAGFYDGEIDGDFGPTSRAAAQAWGQAQGIADPVQALISLGAEPSVGRDAVQEFIGTSEAVTPPMSSLERIQQLAAQQTVPAPAGLDPVTRAPVAYEGDYNDVLDQAAAERLAAEEAASIATMQGGVTSAPAPGGIQAGAAGQMPDPALQVPGVQGQIQQAGAGGPTLVAEGVTPTVSALTPADYAEAQATTERLNAQGQAEALARLEMAPPPDMADPRADIRPELNARRDEAARQARAELAQRGAEAQSISAIQGGITPTADAQLDMMTGQLRMDPAQVALSVDTAVPPDMAGTMDFDPNLNMQGHISDRVREFGREQAELDRAHAVTERLAAANPNRLRDAERELQSQQALSNIPGPPEYEAQREIARAQALGGLPLLQNVQIGGGLDSPPTMGAIQQSVDPQVIGEAPAGSLVGLNDPQVANLGATGVMPGMTGGPSADPQATADIGATAMPPNMSWSDLVGSSPEMSPQRIQDLQQQRANPPAGGIQGWTRAPDGRIVAVGPTGITGTHGGATVPAPTPVTPIYTGGQTASATMAPAAAAVATATSATGEFKDIAPRLMGDLQRDFGFTTAQAAGVVGNLAHETGGFTTMQEGLDAERAARGDRGGLGWPQWTDTSRSSPRRTNFENYAAENGLAIDSYEANYGNLKRELEGEYSGTITRVKATDNARDAMYAFEDSYEGAGIPHYDSRLEWTAQAEAIAPAQLSASVTPSSLAPPSSLPTLIQAAEANDLASISIAPDGTIVGIQDAAGTPWTPAQQAAVAQAVMGTGDTRITVDNVGQLRVDPASVGELGTQLAAMEMAPQTTMTTTGAAEAKPGGVQTSPVEEARPINPPDMGGVGGLFDPNAVAPPSPAAAAATAAPPPTMTDTPATAPPPGTGSRTGQPMTGPGELAADIGGAIQSGASYVGGLATDAAGAVAGAVGDVLAPSPNARGGLGTVPPPAATVAVPAPAAVTETEVAGAPRVQLTAPAGSTTYNTMEGPVIDTGPTNILDTGPAVGQPPIMTGKERDDYIGPAQLAPTQQVTSVPISPDIQGVPTPEQAPVENVYTKPVPAAPPPMTGEEEDDYLGPAPAPDVAPPATGPIMITERGTPAPAYPTPPPAPVVAPTQPPAEKKTFQERTEAASGRSKTFSDPIEYAARNSVTEDGKFDHDKFWDQLGDVDLNQTQQTIAAKTAAQGHFTQNKMPNFLSGIGMPNMGGAMNAVQGGISNIPNPVQGLSNFFGGIFSGGGVDPRSQGVGSDYAASQGGNYNTFAQQGPPGSSGNYGGSYSGPGSGSYGGGGMGGSQYGGGYGGGGGYSGAGSYGSAGGGANIGQGIGQAYRNR